MEVKKQHLQPVLPEDFKDMEGLQRAAHEGRLFIVPPTPSADTTEQRIAEILAYVDRLSPYALNAQVHEIWVSILHDEQLQPLFFLTRYSQKRGQVNWYRVTAVVCLPHEQGVYQQEVSAVQLHCTLEGTECRTKHYSGMSRYLLDQPEIRVVKQILRQFGQ